MTNKLTK